LRKLMMLGTLVVMLVPLVAADQLINCKSAPCYGSRNHDKIYERPRNGAFDKIIMRGVTTSYLPTDTPTTAT
jgi:hypothetical protein